MNDMLIGLEAEDTPQTRYDRARRALAELRHLISEAYLRERENDPFDLAVLRASRGWIAGWAGYYETVLRAVRRREGLHESAAAFICSDNASTSGSENVIRISAARFGAGAHARRVRAALVAARAYAGAEEFIAVDHFGAARMTEELFSFLDAAAGLGAELRPAAVAS